jgi:quinoprotein glucose dehydrogenase
MCTAHQRLFALDAATGKEKWHFDPQLNANPSFQHVPAASLITKRERITRPDVVADCPRRIILPVNDGRLFAVNAETGSCAKPLPTKVFSICRPTCRSPRRVCMNQLHRRSPI